VTDKPTHPAIVVDHAFDSFVHLTGTPTLLHAIKLKHRHHLKCGWVRL